MDSILQKRLKSKIDALDLSIHQLEKKAGLPHSLVQKILQGQTKKPSIESIVALSDALGCSVDELVREGIPNKQPQRIEEDKALLGKIEWDPKLYEECFTFTGAFFKERKIAPDFNKVLFFIREMYIYSLDSKILDKRFAEYILKENFHK